MKRISATLILGFYMNQGLAADTSLYSKIEKEFTTQWNKQFKEQEAKKSTFAIWNLEISPPFPDQWPTPQKLSFYAYAVKRDFINLKDGEYIAAPWSLISIDLSNTTNQKIEFRQLTKTLESLGIQGVNPINEGEESKDFSPASLLKFILEKPMNSTTIHKSYCRWKNRQSVIAEVIAKRHTAFFLDLNCPAK